MLRSLLAVFLVLGGNQAAETFRVLKSSLADVQQDTLEAVNPASKQTTEVFPGSYVSPYGPLVMKRIEALLARLDEPDRDALVAGKIGAGFDRAITSWQAHPSGRTVALAVHYYRDRLLNLKMALSDDYGRPEPLDPAEYQFSTIALCSRAGAGGWTCREDQLAAVAKKHNVTLPNNRSQQDAAVARLLQLALTEK